MNAQEHVINKLLLSSDKYSCDMSYDCFMNYDPVRPGLDSTWRCVVLVRLGQFGQGWSVRSEGVHVMEPLSLLIFFLPFQYNVPVHSCLCQSLIY